MTAVRVSTDVGYQARVAAARAALRDNGTSISAWARENGFSAALVRHILTGKRACLYGESFLIAVALGIRTKPASAPAPAPHASGEPMAIAA